MLDQHVGEILFAALEMQREGGVVVAGKEAHAGGFDGRDDQARGPGGDLPEGGGAGFLDFGVGREVFEGEDVVGGKAQDGVGVERAGEVAGGEDGGVQRLGGLVVRDQDERGGAGCADEERKIEGAGGEGEAGDTSSPAAGTQMATDTLEGDRMFQVREQFADERQNHKLRSSLQPDSV